MRVVFFGTPSVAVPSLDAVLSSQHEVVAVVTQPDKPRGRGRTASASPVKEGAVSAGIEVLQPVSPKDDDFAGRLAGLRPEALAVVAYGHILPKGVLEIAPAMNVHFSLLPRYRGAAPVQRALMDGASRTGVSVFLLEPTVDTGPVLAVEAVDIGPEETAGELLERLAPIGAGMLVRALDDLAAGTLSPREQDDREASPAPKIGSTEARIDWTMSGERVANVVRALNPAPGAHTTLDGKRLNVWRARPADGHGTPGEVLSVEPFVVAAGDAAIELTEVQMEGKKRMSAEAFTRGRRLTTGTILGVGGDIDAAG